MTPINRRGLFALFITLIAAVTSKIYAAPSIIAKMDGPVKGPEASIWEFEVKDCADINISGNLEGRAYKEGYLGLRLRSPAGQISDMDEKSKDHTYWVIKHSGVKNTTSFSATMSHPTNGKWAIEVRPAKQVEESIQLWLGRVRCYPLDEKAPK